jgi:hypothetical protein
MARQSARLSRRLRRNTGLTEHLLSPDTEDFFNVSLLEFNPAFVTKLRVGSVNGSKCVTRLYNV